MPDVQRRGSGTASRSRKSSRKPSKSVITKLRAQLETEREHLLAQAIELEGSAAVGRWRDGGNRDDYADTGSATSERERAQSLARNARRILLQIDDALKRMDAGSYGTCERCGQPIEPARLEALPYATLCLADKQLDERTV